MFKRVMLSWMFLTRYNCWVSLWQLKPRAAWVQDPEPCSVSWRDCEPALGCGATQARRNNTGVCGDTLGRCFSPFLGFSCAWPWSRGGGAGAMPLPCACTCSSAEVRAEECCRNYGCRRGLSRMGIRVWLSQRFPV